MKLEIENDPIFTNYLSMKPNLTKDSKERYQKVMTKFCKSINTPLIEAVNKCKAEQNRVIEKIINHGTDENGNQIIEKEQIKFDVNNPQSQIKQYLDTYYRYCKLRNNKNTTINNTMHVIRTILNYSGVILPKWERLQNDADEWYLLEKEDLKYIIQDSSLVHASFIKFLASSGMRVGDATRLTIGDFMKATSQYHNYIDVSEFIDNAPEDMLATWMFHPKKTKRFSVECVTFSDPESNNLILQNLRKIKNEYLPRKNKRDHLELKLTKDDALFGSKKTFYKGHLKPASLADQFGLKNKKLRAYRINKIKEAIKNGDIVAEDFNKEVEKIPKFHAHACRKFFETVISRNCGNLRICTLMEGHVSPVSTDSSYIKQDINDVREAYIIAIPDLSLENVETKVFTSKIQKEMQKKIDTLENELKEKEAEVKEMDDRILDIEERLSDIDNQTMSRKSILERISESSK